MKVVEFYEAHIYFLLPFCYNEPFFVNVMKFVFVTIS